MRGEGSQKSETRNREERGCSRKRSTKSTARENVHLAMNSARSMRVLMCQQEATHFFLLRTFCLTCFFVFILGSPQRIAHVSTTHTGGWQRLQGDYLRW